jgi:integrase/recombinase XerD
LAKNCALYVAKNCAVLLAEKCVLYITTHSKERDVAISKNTATHLRKYMNMYHPSTSDNPEGWLFYTVIKGKLDHISTATIRRIVRKYADELRAQGKTIPERVYPHLLRAERATNLYQEGVDPLMIATFLGHEQIETTRIYALPSIDKMREAMEKVQPAPSADTDDITPIANDEEAMARLCGLR